MAERTATARARPADRIWYVDSSALLRAMVERTTGARRWFEQASARGDRFVASRLMEVEVRRVTENAGVDQGIVGQYVDESMFLHITDELLDRAIAFDQHLGGAGAIHVASGLLIGADVLVLVSHGRRMLAAARALGLRVLDPVDGDENPS